MGSKPYLIVSGARPNLMKVFPIMKEMDLRNIKYFFLHTGQHHDYEMFDQFFDEKRPKPDLILSRGKNTISSVYEQTCEFFKDNDNFKAVVIAGDVDSTVAVALSAKRNFLKVAHVESGLRSFDMKMPEEQNRVVTDHLSDLLFVTERNASVNLINEGLGSRIEVVGNVMIDSLHEALSQMEDSAEEQKKYIYTTLHRPSNVDCTLKLKEIVDMLLEVAKNYKIKFPLHPRTKLSLQKNNMLQCLLDCDNIEIMQPVTHLESVKLIKEAFCILTDSAGVSEESSYLKIPCLTLRENTERPVTVCSGSNTLVSPREVIEFVSKIEKGEYKKASYIPFWDGKTASRIVSCLEKHFNT